MLLLLVCCRELWWNGDASLGELGYGVVWFMADDTLMLDR